MKKIHESEVREFDNYLEFYSLIDSWDFSETSWVKKNAQGGYHPEEESRKLLPHCVHG